MTLDDIVQSVSGHLKAPPKQVEIIAKAMVGVMITSLKKGYAINIEGFGSFRVMSTTRKRYDVTKRKVVESEYHYVRFKPWSELQFGKTKG